jgi:hypothetical protein
LQVSTETSPTKKKKTKKFKDSQRSELRTIFEASFGYLARPCLKNLKRRERKKGREGKKRKKRI